jgi:hypothetical protein
MAALVFTLALTRSASAAIVVDIDRAVQRMAVTVDGVPRYSWRVSTARRGYITPPGTYHPEMLARHWFSRKYCNSPMPHSIFFYGGFAIHGSYEISHLGRPRLARLRAARSRQRRDPVRPCAARRHGRDRDRDSLVASLGTMESRSRDASEHPSYETSRSRHSLNRHHRT